MIAAMVPGALLPVVGTALLGPVFAWVFAGVAVVIGGLVWWRPRALRGLARLPGARTLAQTEATPAQLGRAFLIAVGGLCIAPVAVGIALRATARPKTPVHARAPAAAPRPPAPPGRSATAGAATTASTAPEALPPPSHHPPARFGRWRGGVDRAIAAAADAQAARTIGRPKRRRRKPPANAPAPGRSSGGGAGQGAPSPASPSPSPSPAPSP